MKHLIILLMAGAAFAAPTTITGPVVTPDGAPATGNAIFALSRTCIGPSGNTVVSQFVVVPFSGGTLTATLEPNDTCLPAGTYYSVNFKLTGGSSRYEVWVVPTSATAVSIASVRTSAIGTPTIISMGISLLTGAVAKGDLIVYDGATMKRLPVGTNGQVLTANSALSNGVGWAAGGGGGGSVTGGACGAGQYTISIDTAGVPTCSAVNFTQLAGVATKAQQHASTPYIDQVNAFGAFRQSFTSSATTPGLRHVPYAGDPSTPSDGDTWYNSSTNKFRCRENGATVDCVSAGGGGQVAHTYLACSGDITTALASALTALNTAGGGTLQLGPGTCTSTAQVLLPNDGASPQANQNNIRITGAGGGGAWYGNNATVLDLRYVSGNTNAKIETRGKGTLMIDHLTLKDGGTSNPTPFIHSTNTTLIVEYNTFIGSGNVAQDFVTLGGVDTTLSNLVTAPFQGYTTHITKNSFRQGNRGVYGLNYANAVQFVGNDFIQNTGTVAIEFDASNSGGVHPDYGNSIMNNTIEMDTYQYGIKGNFLRYSLMAGNDMHDPGVGVVAYYNLTNLSTGNKIICGASPSSKAFLTGDANSLNSTTVLCAENAMADTTGKGKASSELAYGAVIKGTYTSSDLYPGPLVVSDQFNPTERISIGYDHTNSRGVFDCKNNLTFVPCAFLGSVIQVPGAAGATTTVAGGINYDSTNANLHAGAGGVDNIVPLVTTSAPLVNGNYVKALIAAGKLTLIDGGSSAGSPANYYTSTTFTGIGGTSFTPTRTLDVNGSTSTHFYITRGSSQSGNIFTGQWGASANDTTAITSIGSLVGQSNAGGIKFQVVVADASVRLSSDGYLSFNSTTTMGSGATDTALRRSAAGVFAIDNGTSGQYRDLITRKTQGTVVAVASLGTCNAGAEGTRWAVNDALTPVSLATVVGGGSVHVPVYCDGTNWIVN